MKPNTIEVMTALSISQIKDELKELIDNADYIEESDSSGLREMAKNCQNIMDVADALQNILLTAADEIDEIDVAVMEAKSDAVAVEFSDKKEFVDPLDQRALLKARQKDGDT